jgi:DNA-binding HxlR family transcriptional regulator
MRAREETVMASCSSGVSPRTLAKKLKQLEAIQLVKRRAYAGIPLRVGYSLSERGEKFALVLNDAWKLLEEWYG